MLGVKNCRLLRSIPERIKEFGPLPETNRGLVGEGGGILQYPFLPLINPIVISPSKASLTLYSKVV
jgi:hypothetical protein